MLTKLSVICVLIPTKSSNLILRKEEIHGGTKVRGGKETRRKARGADGTFWWLIGRPGLKQFNKRLRKEVDRLTQNGITPSKDTGRGAVITLYKFWLVCGEKHFYFRTTQKHLGRLIKQTKKAMSG